jgi:glycerol-3-phosphate acyltransferase PlsY
VSLELIAIWLGAYLIGSIPSGYILARLKRVDVRQVGSGNIGATNVTRAAGRGLGLLTLIIDVAKGALPVLLATSLELVPNADASFDQRARVGAAIAAFLGHVFPIFLGFRGGKGVATALGAILALAPLVIVLPLVVFTGVFVLRRVVSLASMSAALAAPLSSAAFGQPASVTWATGLIALVIMIRHRENVGRLRAGTEPRFGG